ncbi:hypothetical protein BCT06_12735 [Vibrio breoganii]|uniref:hypothetical protein n=1 Tax=Vibrio breoganii TaxID=553239 RepID=UPI000C84BB91|nr:hypothetical protein [Vibrio breoganii]PMO60356.1 hypothetical protein BCT06_12735 [Vibrio breoganii]
MLKQELQSAIKAIDECNQHDSLGFYGRAKDSITDLIGHIEYKENTPVLERLSDEEQMLEDQNRELLEMALYANLCQEGSHSSVLMMVCHLLMNIELKECLGDGCSMSEPATLKHRLDDIEDYIDSAVSQTVKVLTKRYG